MLIQNHAASHIAWSFLRPGRCKKWTECRASAFSLSLSVSLSQREPRDLGEGNIHSAAAAIRELERGCQACRAKEAVVWPIFRAFSLPHLTPLPWCKVKMALGSLRPLRWAHVPATPPSSHSNPPPTVWSHFSGATLAFFLILCLLWLAFFIYSFLILPWLTRNAQMEMISIPLVSIPSHSLCKFSLW